ncbi:nucleoside diphosphate kinase III [Citrus sinensis]|uniref:Nucleoside diphosphate kinase III n=1 Tax=Citrus sinensis TaxID=2711 RepID=A0ACB8LPA1_CITSI|nr:nucleoside diphosphate kinase III [Citrus sinensis]
MFKLFAEGRAVSAAAAVTFSGKLPYLVSSFGRAGSSTASRSWLSGAIAIPAAGYRMGVCGLWKKKRKRSLVPCLSISIVASGTSSTVNYLGLNHAYTLQEQEVHAAEMERTFIAIKPDGVQRGLISEIISRFERKGFKLVAIKIVVPSKEFAQKHYHDLKERPFFNGLCEFLSSGPVIAMVWEGEGVITYGRKLIGATDPQKSEPGTIRGDLAVVVGRNIIHGSDGPETAKDEIKLWFKPEDLVNYTSNAEKWVYESK